MTHGVAMAMKYAITLAITFQTKLRDDLKFSHGVNTP